MKTKVSIFAFVLFLLGVIACQAESDRKYIDRQVDELTERIVEGNRVQNKELGELNSRVEKLEERLQTQTETINKLIEQLNNLQNTLGKNAEQISILGDEKEKDGKRWVIALWIGIPIIVLLLLGLVFLFLPTPSNPAGGALEGSENTKCPRCGWKHDPGDTICKNPDCKTQF